MYEACIDSKFNPNRNMLSILRKKIIQIIFDNKMINS